MPIQIKKNIPVIFSVLLLIMGTAVLPGQSAAGTWVESQYKVTLKLSANGTYTLQHPGGSSSGRWETHGQQFCLQDNFAAQPVCYSVVQYTANLMVLRDVNGVVMNYKLQSPSKPAGPALPGGTPAAATTASAGQVLARQGQYTLTMGQFQHGIDLLQLIIGQRVKLTELNQLRAKTIEEFNQAPANTVQKLNSIGQSIQRVRSAADPARIGLVRQELFVALYKATVNMREDQKPLLIQVMNRYIKVLSFDRINNLLLTSKDVDGYINYLAFNSELAGQKVQVNAAVRQSMTQQLVAGFPIMPLEQKKILASASLIWELLSANWQRLTPAQKQQYKNAYYQKVASNFPSPPPSNQYTPPTRSTSKKSPTQQRREYNARQNMFNIMNNMNMNSHALSMNIIENIGGTGNYWQVVDY